tara:strand:- start:617 stop:829 length:213 start_codon:yes stop_codon:yes gene_type:complete
MDNNNITPFPIVSNALVSELDELFPPKEFSPKDDLRNMDYYFGQRNIVNFLRAKNAEQQENILTNNNNRD